MAFVSGNTFHSGDASGTESNLGLSCSGGSRYADQRGSRNMCLYRGRDPEGQSAFQLCSDADPLAGASAHSRSKRMLDRGKGMDQCADRKMEYGE